MTRLTDAELAAMEVEALPGSITEEWARLLNIPRLLAELKAERERCAELRRLLKEHAQSQPGYCIRCGCVTCPPFCAIAKALRETE